MSISSSPSARPADEPDWWMHGEINVGIITALSIEFASMESLLIDVRQVQPEGDPNTYSVATLPSNDDDHPHRVALVTLPEQVGTRSAAVTCSDMLRSFPAIRCVIMVGIAGGIPRPHDPPRHVRLGDVVVATRGIVDYGHGRQVDGEHHPRRQTAGMVSSWLSRAVSSLRAEHARGRRPLAHLLDPQRTPQAGRCPRPSGDADILYARGLVVQHPNHTESGHPATYPKIHYGAVASADVLVRDEIARDNLATEFPDLMAIEMEGAGIAASTAAHDLPWFMVRGITDYCDNVGKNDVWHQYAAYAAAAYVRALLAAAPPVVRVLPLFPREVHGRVRKVLRHVSGVDVGRVWRATVPDLMEPPAGVFDTPERAFLYLSAMNADTSGLHPTVRFVDGLGAACADLETAERLHRDAEALAALTRSGRELEAWRSRPLPPEPDPDRSQPCLMIEIDWDGIDGQMCRIGSYLQDAVGSWRPRPGPGFEGIRLDAAEQRVGELVDRLEQEEWHSGQVTIEFFLPVGLLNLPVEWWRPHTTRQRPLPPLCVDYPVVVRSLERMRRSARPRIWRNRWNALAATPLRNVHWGADPQTVQDLAEWEVQLRADQGLTSVVLSSSPDSWPGEDELDTALQAEVPVIVWDRHIPPVPEGMETIRRLVGGTLVNLPKRTRDLRAEAAGRISRGDAEHPGQFVALLWDDPERTVPPDAVES